MFSDSRLSVARRNQMIDLLAGITRREFEPMMDVLLDWAGDEPVHEERLASDVEEFRAAITAGDPLRAAQLATGPFLDGFFLTGSEGFERWVEDERTSLAGDATRALLSLARAAESSGELDAAADWWRRLTRIDPLSGRFALGFLKALAARGDRAGA